MSSCLGLYINNEIVKYAKLSYENKKITLEHFGTRFVKFDNMKVIEEIIEETNSQSTAIAINPGNSTFVNIQIFDQGQVKSYLADIAKMEFEAWCEKNAKSPANNLFVYKVADVKGDDGKKSAVLNIAEKKSISEYTETFSNRLASVYSPAFVIERLVPEDERNCAVVNFDENLTITIMLDGNVVDIKSFDIGMKKILSDFTEKLGSYQKSYEACKQINVYSEGEDNNNKELEFILEPTLQDILKYVQANVNNYRKQISKVFIAGSGVVFTNLDILFTEYLEIKSELLKPDFLDDTSNVRNVADIVESIEAIALAYDALVPIKRESEFVKSAKMKNSFRGIFSKKSTKVKPVKQKKEKAFDNGGLKVNENEAKPEKEIEVEDFSKTTSIVTCVAIILFVLLIAYVTFTNIYTNKLTNMKNEVLDNIAKLNSNTATVKQDTAYITENTAKYKEINDRVSTIVRQIESNQIGKFSTYNVASFMQNIIKIIPKNVQLVNISSDDNKNIKIKAKSDRYADLGYFVSILKINNVLKNIKINSVQNATTSRIEQSGANNVLTTIEIGGELP